MALTLPLPLSLCLLFFLLRSTRFLQAPETVCNKKMATSALNPNAPMFVPSAYRTVEDFSDQWWDLVHSSPWFCDYWLRECFSDPQIESLFLDITGGDDDQVHGDSSAITEAFTKGKEGNMDLVALGWLKWRKPRGVAEMPRYCEKSPKFVSMRVNPRPIQQPR
ncbi:hypothetical protein MIMGU_mgv1a015167mg [Erythranthe guttata]|uniref:Uncharacterized protein n=1 Tax=Erythranthe guttata TaxID=4155 RepID=A0A022PX40_ERYGU|nr:hypothetical protein MIMGU_mgv1a015167mg [Erythranthe guttata]